MPPPGPPDTRDGLGAVKDHTGDPVVRFRRRHRRREAAELWHPVVDTQPTGTISVAWDQADTPAEAEIEAVGRAAAGRLVWLSLPTSSPWRHPIEMLWRQLRREVPPGELCASLDARLKAAPACVARDHQRTGRVRSIIGAHAAYLSWLYLASSIGNP